MLGTPKQIEWAADIRQRFLDSMLGSLERSAARALRGNTGDFSGVFAGVKSNPTDPGFWRVLGDAFEDGGNHGREAIDRVAEILEHQQAKWWIDNRGWLEDCLPVVLAQKSVGELEFRHV